MKNIKQILIVFACIAITVFGVITINYAATTIGTNISTGGTLDVTGNVGIGTTTPNNKLTVYSASKAGLEFSGASGDTYKWTMGLDMADAGKFKIASSTALGTSDVFTIDGNGNVGIGTTTPANALEIKGTARAEKMILIHESEFSDLLANAPIAALHIRTEAGTTAGIYTAWTPMDLTYPYGENLQMGEWDGTTFKERMRISGTVEGRGGFVGIGVTNPSSMLHISTTTIDSAMTITSGAGSWIMGMDFSDEGKFKIASSTVLGTADRLTIDNGGNVGIGTTTPGASLDVDNGTATTTIEVGDALTGGKGACFKLRDHDDAGWTYCSVLNGAMTCSANSCE